MKLCCSFIDYRKAFDKVWRDGLWLKLRRSGVMKHTKFYNVIVNMYSNVKSCVSVSGERSVFFPSLIGVRQGENLSPLLFSLFVNDLETYLEEKNNNFLNFEDETCNNFLKLMVLMYADDTIILSNSAAGLQKALNDLSKYCNKWKLAVNSDKTKVTVFGNRKNKKTEI